jgi:hypothetical protein
MLCRSLQIKYETSSKPLSIYIKYVDYEELHSDVRLCKGIPYKKR